MGRDLAILMAAMESGFTSHNAVVRQPTQRESVEPSKPRTNDRATLRVSWLHKLLPLKTLAAVLSFLRLA